MINKYETVFIMTPVLSEDKVKDEAKKYGKFLEKAGGKLIHQENWGLRKLAYPIQKKTTGFYNLMEYEAEGGLIASLEVKFSRDERILRFLTMKMDKHAIAYSERRKAKAVERKEAKAEEEKEPEKKKDKTKTEKISG